MASAASEQCHLQDIRREHLRGRRTDAFQDRNAADLLPDEHARDAPHADAAEHDDHEPDEAEEVLRALQALADPVFRRPIRARRDEPILEALPHIVGEPLDALLAHLQQQLVIRAAAEGQQTRLLQIGEVDEHPRTKAEAADAAAGFLVDHAANRERPAAHHDSIANLHAELREQLRPHERAVVFDERMRVLLPVLQHERAIERVGRFDAA